MDKTYIFASGAAEALPCELHERRYAIIKDHEENKIEPDAYHHHEAGDRAWTVHVMLNELLSDHIVIEKHCELKSQVEKLSDLIYDLYSSIPWRGVSV